MADRYIFTPPGAIIPMVEALRVVASIETANLERLADLLVQQTGFLTDEKLAKLVAECVDDEEQGSAVFNALQNVGPSGVDEVLEMLRAWRESDEQRRRQFPEESLADLGQKLPVLIRDYPALNRSKRADQIRNVLGNELEGIAFICDARPVYNKTRDRIEGLIPLTTMKLVYETQNLVTEEIEIVLTSDQLESLISEAKQAAQELATLRQSIIIWIPEGCVDNQEEKDADEA